jgi:CheY-like chemotaxis protein
MTDYNFQDINLLCIDDNRNMHMILKIILNAMRIKNIQFCTAAEEGLELVKTTLPDLVITDLEMEPVGGLELIRTIRTSQDSADPYVPILVVTSYADRQRVTAARDAGATEILAKPVSIKALYDRLVWILENPRPFIKSNLYAGPDRRRATLGFEGMEKRDND